MNSFYVVFNIKRGKMLKYISTIVIDFSPISFEIELLNRLLQKIRSSFIKQFVRLFYNPDFLLILLSD